MMTRTGSWEKCGVGGNLTVMASRPPNPLSQRRKQTEVWREKERIYSWLLLWVLCQNKPLWWARVLFSQQSATVTQHWLQLKQGQEETNKGNEIWIWNQEKQLMSLLSAPWAVFNKFRLENLFYIWQIVIKIPTTIILKPFWINYVSHTFCLWRPNKQITVKQEMLLLEKHEQTCLIN